MQYYLVNKLEISEKESSHWRENIKLMIKVIVLTFVFMIVMGISSGVAGLNSASLVENASQVMGITLFVFFLQTIALSYPIIKSNLKTWHLVLLVAVAYFGIATFLVQIETLVFLDYFTSIINPEMIPQLFIQGAVTSIIIAPVAVLLLRGRKSDANETLQSVRLGMSKLQALVKVSTLAVLFVIFYVFFGIFVAWQNPALGEYYGDLIAKMADVGTTMLLLQAGRALVFIMLAFPIVKTSQGRTWEKALMIGLLFCILTASNLLIPTSFMPGTVRMSHFTEIAIPGFIFGVLVAWLMNRSHSSIGDLFGRVKEVDFEKTVVTPEQVIIS